MDAREARELTNKVVYKKCDVRINEILQDVRCAVNEGLYKIDVVIEYQQPGSEIAYNHEYIVNELTNFYKYNVKIETQEVTVLFFFKQIAHTLTIEW